MLKECNKCGKEFLTEADAYIYNPISQEFTCACVLEQHKVLVDSYNSLCDSLDRGEHIDMDWVRAAIEESAHSHMAGVYQRRITYLEKRIEYLESKYLHDVEL
jgi:hypothetical protein